MAHGFRQMALPGLERPRTAPANRTSTSIDAAARIAAVVPRLQREVLTAIAAAGDRGATRAEIAVATGIKLQTVCGRCNELLEAREIFQTAERRDGGKVLRLRRAVDVVSD